MQQVTKSLEGIGGGKGGGRRGGPWLLLKFKALHMIGIQFLQ